MPQWPSISLPSLSSRPFQLILTFSFGALTATTVLYAASALHRRRIIEELKASIPAISPTHHADQLTEYGAAVHDGKASYNNSAALRNLNKEDERASKLATRARRGDYDDALILEQLTRTQAFLTPDGLDKLRSSFVIVVGLGGVGSHAVATLARSGCSRIRIVDFDQVTLSSLNRHALATLADVGTPKTICVRKRLEHICPWVRIDARNELFSSTSADHLLGGWDYDLRDDEETDSIPPSYVLDCIDNIDSKVALLQYCHMHSLSVISSMGAGCKSDPTRLNVGDISNSLEDPLSKSTRRRLRILGINSGIPVVFSTEKPGPGKASLLTIPDSELSKGTPDALAVLPDFRVRILPVLGTMPAVFGYTLANHVICSLAGYPLEYTIGDRNRDKMYDGILSVLQGCEQRLARSASSDKNAAVGLRIPLGTSDVAYLVEEVFRGKSVISAFSNRLALVRWRRPEGGFAPVVNDATKMARLAMSDLVLMTKEEAGRHERDVLLVNKRPEDVYEADVLALVERRMAEEREFDRYR